MRFLSALVFIWFLLFMGGCRGCKGPTDGKPHPVDPRNVSNNEGFSGAPSLGLDAQANVHITWSDSTPGNLEIYYAVKYQDQPWEKPMNISNTSEKSAMPSLTIDPLGNVHVVWVEYFRSPDNMEIYYSMKPSGADWTSPTNLSNSAANISDLPQIGVDDGGNVHVIWMEQRICYTTKPPGGEWTAPITISPHASWNPALCVTSEGYAHAVWEMSYVGGNEEIFYSERPPGGDWSEPINISNSSQWYSWVAKVAADGEGSVYVVWIEEEKSTLYFSARSVDGSWLEPDSLGGTTAHPGRPLHSSIVVEAQGTLHLAWDRRSLNPDISYMYKTSEDSWSEPRNISNTPGASLGQSLGVDAQGTVYIAWSDETPGNWEIYYDRIE